MRKHYRWSARDQRWKIDHSEFAMIIVAVVLVVSVMAIALALR